MTSESERYRESLSWKDADRNSNSLLPPVKYNSRAHSRLDNPRSLCMKTYYAPGNVSARSRVCRSRYSLRASKRPAGPETHCRLLRFSPLHSTPLHSIPLFRVRHDKSNYTFKLRYTILSPFSSSSSSFSCSFVRMCPFIFPRSFLAALFILFPSYPLEFPEYFTDSIPRYRRVSPFFLLSSFKFFIVDFVPRVLFHQLKNSFTMVAEEH